MAGGALRRRRSCRAGWQDALINNLHLIPECSIWGQARPPIGAWCAEEDGLFGLNECPRGCPQIECLPCSFYGNIPLVYFFPEAALSTLRGYKAYQFADGRPPWIFGGITATEEANRPGYDLSAPDMGYQTVLNGACYVIMVDRYWQVSGDDAVLAEFWDSLKRCNDFSMNLRPAYGLAQVMAMPTPGTDTHGLGRYRVVRSARAGLEGLRGPCRRCAHGAGADHAAHGRGDGGRRLSRLLRRLAGGRRAGVGRASVGGRILLSTSTNRKRGTSPT